MTSPKAPRAGNEVSGNEVSGTSLRSTSLRKFLGTQWNSASGDGKVFDGKVFDTFEARGGPDEVSDTSRGRSGVRVVFLGRPRGAGELPVE